MFILIGVDGKEYGPASAELIREWIAAGRASLKLTQARRVEETQLQLLGSFPEFLPASAPLPLDITLPPPVSADPVSAPLAAIPVPVSFVDDPALAARGARFLAKLIDWVLFLLAASPLFFALFYIGFAYGGELRDYRYYTLAGVLLLVLIATQVILLTLRGQTVGKMIMHLRVVNYSDGTPADFLHVILLRAVVCYAIRLVPLLGPIFYLIDSCFIFSREKRCLHDLIAGTKVIKV